MIFNVRQNEDSAVFAMQVPEIDASTAPALNMDMLSAKLEMAQATVGVQKAVPIIVGPVTMARLANLSGIDVPTFTQKLMPVYTELLSKLTAMNVRHQHILL